MNARRTAPFTAPLSPCEAARLTAEAKRRAHALRRQAVDDAIDAAARSLARLKGAVRPPVSGAV